MTQYYQNRLSRYVRRYKQYNLSSPSAPTVYDRSRIQALQLKKIVFGSCCRYNHNRNPFACNVMFPKVVYRFYHNGNFWYMLSGSVIVMLLLAFTYSIRRENIYRMPKPATGKNMLRLFTSKVCVMSHIGKIVKFTQHLCLKSLLSHTLYGKRSKMHYIIPSTAHLNTTVQLIKVFS